MVTAAMIKRCLLLGRKAMANLDSVLKRRYITLATKVPLVKTMVFPAVGREVGGRFGKRGDTYMNG